MFIATPWTPVGQAELEQRPDDGPIRLPRSFLARKVGSLIPSRKNEPDSHTRDGDARDGGAHRGSLWFRTRGSVRAPRINSTLRQEVEDGHRQARDSRGPFARPPQRATLPPSMKNISMPMLKTNRSRRKGKASALHRGCGVDDFEQEWRERIPKRCEEPTAQHECGQERLVNGPIDTLVNRSLRRNAPPAPPFR